MDAQVAASLQASLRDSVRDEAGGLFRPSHKRVFRGAEAVRALIAQGCATNESDAVSVATALMQEGVFSHVNNERGTFRNSDKDLYRFATDEEFHGRYER
jgi:hypothetical protein